MADIQEETTATDPQPPPPRKTAAMSTAPADCLSHRGQQSCAARFCLDASRVRNQGKTHMSGGDRLPNAPVCRLADLRHLKDIGGKLITLKVGESTMLGQNKWRIRYNFAC